MDKSLVGFCFKFIYRNLKSLYWNLDQEPLIYIYKKLSRPYVYLYLWNINIKHLILNILNLPFKDKNLYINRKWNGKRFQRKQLRRNIIVCLCSVNCEITSTIMKNPSLLNGFFLRLSTMNNTNTKKKKNLS